MSDTVIKVENLGKKYLIRHQQRERYTALRDVLTNKFKSFGKRLISLQPPSSNLQPSREDFWALKDVSFEVKQGDRIGIIGRNGAGKTTLLKLLSRITEPTTGRIAIKGRVASLLEVGTGFHPELTGRENIYLNGAILGMTKAEIKRKFDEIVDFAEIEKFLDTPIKRYSSGMYVRLAFAVAAHLEPEILLVDEVLAVGDIAFQKKCLGKMGHVAKEGRTILFVSHQMGAIAQLCSNAILLRKGGIVKEGDTQPVIDYYLSEASSESNNGYTASPNSDKDMFISKAQALNSEGKPTSHFTHKEPIVLAVTCVINSWVSNTVMGFFIRDSKGRKVFTNINTKWVNIDQRSREIYVTAAIPSNFLVPGQYIFTFAISIPQVSIVDLAEDALTITIIDVGSEFSMFEGYDYGCVFVDCKWSIENIKYEAG
jgi:lipopolysaccharide transport system ATP-binding protein